MGVEAVEINFYDLTFSLVDDKILLTDIGRFAKNETGRFCEVQVAGENKKAFGVKMINSSECDKLVYVSHSISPQKLIIIQKSQLVEVTSTFIRYDDSNSFRVRTSVKNITDSDLVLEEVSAFVFSGIGSVNAGNDIEITRFSQSHHAECQPITDSFEHLGFFPSSPQYLKKFCVNNVGSWSTKEHLPQGILHNKAIGEMLMFQIECNNSWYYEIGTMNESYYLYMSGANSTNSAWSKRLYPNEEYESVSVSIALGKTLNEVLGHMTRHRRHLAGKCDADKNIPAIFNEYMHLSWDSPSEDNVKKYAPVVAKTGCEYYVIDCGWHDEADPKIIYHYVGKWRESNIRFPSGVKATLDYIKSLNMKPGLWIEPESVGWKSEIIDYYNDNTCFFCRHGKPVVIKNRRFLDYRHPKVIEYMTESIRYMVEDLGAEYIKFDYNQDCAIGTEIDAILPGDGLESASRAYLNWIDSLRIMFPQVVFETCSAGGMRMDYATLSHFSIVSTSDQIRYQKYPYIAGNVLAAVLPEQAAVWSYPVDSKIEGFTPTVEWVDQNVSNEQIIMNMVNGLVGRIHLSSHIELFSDEKLALIKEGITYYNLLKDIKKTAVPYMPLGLTRFGKELVASGLMTDYRLYLAVWNLDGDQTVHIPLNDVVPVSVKIGYPGNSQIQATINGNTLVIEFTEKIQAVMLEIELNNLVSTQRS